MKYAVTIFITAVLVFLGATVYYKGLPHFSTPNGVSVTNVEIATTPAGSATALPEDSQDSLIAAVKAALIKEHGNDADALTISVEKVEGEYAKGTASEQGGGGIWFAVRQDGYWTLVWDGNGQIDCTSVSPYPYFPADLMPECWDTTTNKLVTR